MSTITEILAERQAKIDLEVIGRLEAIYGRVPTNDEIRQHLHVALGRDGQQIWRHKDQLLLHVPAIRWVERAP